MFGKLYFFINLIRGIPAYWVGCLSGAGAIIRSETRRYTWFLEDNPEGSFSPAFTG